MGEAVREVNRTPGKEASGSRAFRSSNRASFWTRRSQTPTYEVVGELGRFDARDVLSSRAALKAGTDHYQDYYSRHPEREEKDKKLRPFASAEAREHQRSSLFGDEPLALALSNACKIAYLLGDTNCGQVAERKVEVDRRVAAKSVKAAARYFGADLVGICELNPAWVYSHCGNDDTPGLKWGDPIDLNHRYAIAIAAAHNFDMLLSGRGIGIMPTIETNETAFSKVTIPAIRLASYIRALGYPADAHMMTSKVNAVAVAVDAGLGEVGRNGLLITKEYGPGVRINVVTTELPMALDMPVDLGVQDFCERCFKCADTCSSGSISRRGKETIRGVKLWPVDNDLCSYLRASQGGEPVCFNCLSCCPWTKPHNFVHQSAAWLAARFSLARTALIWMDDVLYGRIPHQHPLPEWLESDMTKRNFKERLSVLLHKI
ncbi:MAG: hypothetical protein HY671_05535 [Chloroflexi bacterium]|nr:hypothetical protein [Chloroflexota bacterium]